MTESRLQRFRRHRDHFFQTSEHSPLTPEQRESFSGLRYFDENPQLVFRVTPDATDLDETPLVLGTTTGEHKEYVRVGRLNLTIDGETVQLTLFREVGRGRYFLPFRDGTSGQETYQLGRYLDPQETPDGTILIDFNYAYNSYCAYNEQWSCPIPPFENRITASIRAGEKTFKLAESLDPILD